MVKHVGAALHALTINVDIPGISNPVSRYLIDLPEMIRETEATSRKHGLDLLEALKAEAARVGSLLTTEEIAVSASIYRRCCGNSVTLFRFCFDWVGAK
ncbi:hypothetical protein X773_26905 [Mesorhizobium sp. LSJC285A00]|uniref:hypothetical protein n=1 Tax=unclassified Mesorhizobium TaxID=325217 RepID=UPI0003CE3628|nr:MULTISPECIES: hypothetical protein [unclassified Mesorhizobium]ESW74484.1 hypothetical protein X773_26905 [Mesorhizobium sp. LSJC285A00]ESW84007.1 hypothetical protein X770_25785 [Mesorhizobium sp. LSJC269B00]